MRRCAAHVRRYSVSLFPTAVVLSPLFLCAAERSRSKSMPPAPAPPRARPPVERKIVFAANATADDKRKGVTRLLAARKGDVGAMFDVAQWFADGVVLEKSLEACMEWLECAAAA